MKKVIFEVEVEDEDMPRGVYNSYDAKEKGLCGKNYLVKDVCGYTGINSISENGDICYFALATGSKVIENNDEGTKVPEYIIELMSHIQECHEQSVIAIQEKTKVYSELIVTQILEKLSMETETLKNIPQGNGISEQTLLKALQIVSQ